MVGWMLEWIRCWWAASMLEVDSMVVAAWVLEVESMVGGGLDVGGG